MRTRAFVTVLGLVAAGLVGPLLLSPTPAVGAARVTVANDSGDATADKTYATTLKVSGSGFQSIKGGHGGIYVFFGTVKGTWQPSKGGQTGTNYLYVPDSESKNNQGYQKFVTYPGSDTAGAANGGEISASGKWSTEMKVPGATFTAVDRDGKAKEVDCLEVTCGIITIGAHGVKNAKNETFTPVSFADLYDGQEPAATATTAAPTTAAPTTDDTTTEEEPAATATTAAPKAANATVAVDTNTAVVGRVLSFTGAGFTPGEQVIATLDDGKAAVGPLSAGPSGEVAGVLQLPEGTTTGTHVLKLTGAASGAAPTINFPIAADTSPVSEDTDDESGAPSWLPWAFLALAVIALLSAVSFAVLRFRSIRRRKKPTKKAPSSGEAAHAL